ncbi:MAG TPA: dTDP-4-dehydrorhamnose 3,5-epimerase [Gemmatimonadales bacterium]|nr:dTDP-4-dehydrorhamnose 3,5-epimerase [Gemmatimonadales bacterium]
MRVAATELAGVLIIEPVVHRDGRGFFLESWREERYRAAGVDLPFVQDNHSRSAAGVLRGLHYQVETPQGKLVRAVAGEIFDVAVDLRRSSPTFGRWVGAVLSDANHRQLWIPAGFAHGFYVTSASADVLYKCTAPYAPAHERCLRWDDPALGIAWPLRAGEPPIVSPRDAAGATLSEAATFV